MVECSIWYRPYTLIPKASLNAKSSAQVRHGALLRVSGLRQGYGGQAESVSGVGFADCHPWPELGDIPLEEQLQKLAKRECTPLTLRSLFFAGVDASFRDKKKSCFAELEIPPSHFLVPDLFSRNDAELDKFVEEGGRAFKFKVGRDLLAERIELENLAERFSKREILFRLDSNLVGDEFSCHRFLKQSSERLIGILDFWEDPFPYSAEAWKNLSDTHGIFVARDRGAKLEELGGVDVLVLKPALQDVHSSLEKLQRLRKRVVITSYLDHPLGQVAAAFVAAKAKKILGRKLDVCGLLSHAAYENNEFSVCLRVKGPNLLPVSGTGFGFDELLEKQDWGKLV